MPLRSCSWRGSQVSNRFSNNNSSSKDNRSGNNRGIRWLSKEEREITDLRDDELRMKGEGWLVMRQAKVNDMTADWEVEVRPERMVLARGS